DNIGPLEAGEISLLGPNLPHAWQFEDPPCGGRKDIHGIIIYFKEDFLGADFFQRPEAERIQRLLKRSAVGLQVRGKTHGQAAALMKAIVAKQGFQRVLDLLQLLDLLAGSEETVPICSAGFLPHLPDQHGERLRRVCELIQQRIAEPLHRDEIARLAHFSPGAFSRFFKARTGKTFHEFVNELRIGRACRLLAEQELNITEIALGCGFANVASFSRSFRRAKSCNPTQFRRRVQSLN
ncbi:MAG TPA: AraC family transcriptional regulator, partial [Chthoniobacter sp.]|nr:AraC family transcriptional regulator [Chthoniobacter sp.]